MAVFEYIIPDLKAIDSFAKEFWKYFSKQKVFALEGEMGSGKTTTIAALVKALGSRDVVQSPTYALVNQYTTQQLQTVYHFDFYRLKHEEEGFEAGLDELIYSGNYCFIEWPSVAPGLLPDRYVKIHIQLLEDGRKVSAEVID
jgi:tRNA threonylcarbamoyladenosine biosynthesis protein TsaE